MPQPGHSMASTSKRRVSSRAKPTVVDTEVEEPGSMVRFLPVLNLSCERASSLLRMSLKSKRLDHRLRRKERQCLWSYLPHGVVLFFHVHTGFVGMLAVNAVEGSIPCGH